MGSGALWFVLVGSGVFWCVLVCIGVFCCFLLCSGVEDEETEEENGEETER